MVLTKHFGDEFAKDKAKYTKGVVKRIVGQIAHVLWEDTPKDGKTWKSHVSRLTRIGTVSADGMRFNIKDDQYDLALQNSDYYTAYPRGR
jgi:hypothetical protein